MVGGCKLELRKCRGIPYRLKAKGQVLFGIRIFASTLGQVLGTCRLNLNGEVSLLVKKDGVGNGPNRAQQGLAKPDSL